MDKNQRKPNEKIEEMKQRVFLEKQAKIWKKIEKGFKSQWNQKHAKQKQDMEENAWQMLQLMDIAFGISHQYLKKGKIHLLGKIRS